MAEAYLRPELADIAPEQDAASALAWAESIAANAAREHIFRNKEGRITLRFEWLQRRYFLKLHRGVGWVEIFKNLAQFRLPVLGASNEYHAAQKLDSLGVATLSVAAYASAGINPAKRHSLVVTDDLVGTISLEDYCASWAQKPAAKEKIRLLRSVAASARIMHGAGINHRDFYLCHFHLQPHTIDDYLPVCHLIDLHRAQMRRQVPRRWREKDLAGLYFSAMDCGLSQRDLLRFIRLYSGRGLRTELELNKGLWRRVEVQARALYLKQHGHPPPPMMGAQKRV